MAYEIDFIGVGTDVKQDASAICMRWKVRGGDGNEIYKVAVYDGGFEEHGKRMIKHMNEYYFHDPNNEKNASDKFIDLVIVSHPDRDHATGIKYILENFKVGKLVMNRPWLYIDELWDKVNDGRITKESLEKRLREQYGVIAELEEIANRKKIPIVEAFQGELLENVMMVCSPGKQFYLDLLAESAKTPFEGKVGAGATIIQRGLKKFKNYILSLAESWDKELLREDVETSADNEMSLVIRGAINGSGFLLCGDAGIRALDVTINYLNTQGEDIRETVSFYEVPHHGSRHNVTPSILDRLIGDKVGYDDEGKNTAFVSAAVESDHPLRMVTNAFRRRGVKVYKTSDGIICHRDGDMPERGWNSVEEIGFYEEVEEWT